MATDAFIQFQGLPGESGDDKHKEWVEIHSFNFGASQAAQAVSSGNSGPGVERVSMSDLSFTKDVDKTSAKLFERCCSAEAFPTVKLEVCRAGGEKLTYIAVTLSHVIVSSYQLGGGTGGLANENITLAFGKIEHTYTQQKLDGGPGGKISAGWDLTANKKV